MLNEPNADSPANSDAARMYRKWRDSNGTQTGYRNKILHQVAISRNVAAAEGVIIPTTVQEYTKSSAQNASVDDLFDDTDCFEQANDDEEEEDCLEDEDDDKDNDE